MIIHKGDENLTVKYTSPKITSFKTPMDKAHIPYIPKQKKILFDVRQTYFDFDF